MERSVAKGGRLYQDFVDEMEALRSETFCRELAFEWDSIVWSYGLKLTKPCFALSQAASPLGSWDSQTRTITLSREALERLTWDSVMGLLKHEIAHQYVDEVHGGHGGEPHGEAFRLACDRLGLLPPFRKAHLGLDDVWEQARRRQSWPERLERRMKRLEALAEAGRGNCHEAGVAEAMLAKLRHEFSIYLQDDQARDRDHDFFSATVDLKKRRSARHHAAAAGLVARHFAVEVIFASGFNVQLLERTKTVVFLGRRDHVEMAHFAFSFILAESERAWRDARAQGDWAAGDGQSFRLGFVMGFDESMKKPQVVPEDLASPQATVSEQSREQSRALTKTSESRLLARFVATQFPRLSSSRGRSGCARSPALSAGRDRGRAAVLPRPLQHDGPRTVVRSLTAARET